MTDAELLSRSRVTPEIFGTVYERHAGAVFRFLSRRVGAASAEDLLAEVFTTAFAARARFLPHESGSALPWLYGIAMNLVRGHLRRRQPSLSPVEVDVVDWSAVDDRLDAAARRAELRVALAALSPVERELLLLVAWEGLAPSEAGAALGLTPTAARSRLHRARSRAQMALGSPLERTT